MIPFEQQTAISTCISMLKSGKPIKIKMSGNSMFPNIKNGDICIINPVVSIEDIKLGDILVFGNQTKLVAHRLLKIERNNEKIYYYCKGDSRFKLDSKISFESIIGKVDSMVINNIETKIGSQFKNGFSTKVNSYLFPFYYLFWRALMRLGKRHRSFLF